jgi:hypothetical protein
MAIINTYPTATPKGADLLIGTQVKDDTVLENSTKSFTVDALGSYIVTSTSGITGSGTLRQIPMFTPNGQAIGDSVMFQIPNNPWIQVGVVGSGQETVLGPGFVSTTALGVINIQAIDGGSVTLLGNVVIGNADTDLLTVTSTSRFYNDVQLGSDNDDNIVVEGTMELQGPIKDNSANLPSSAGQILVGGVSGNVTWTDSTDIVSGAVAKLIPFQITASAGGSSTYSANNNIVEIGWTGSNGTYVLNIPSATAIPYRNIRFVTNSTFPNGASDKVQITAQAGETIDGAAFFEISKVYEGVSLWSNGTEWIVIQAKAH